MIELDVEQTPQPHSLALHPSGNVHRMKVRDLVAVSEYIGESCRKRVSETVTQMKQLLEAASEGRTAAGNVGAVATQLQEVLTGCRLPQGNPGQEKVWRLLGANHVLGASGGNALAQGLFHAGGNFAAARQFMELFSENLDSLWITAEHLARHGKALEANESPTVSRSTDPGISITYARDRSIGDLSRLSEEAQELDRALITLAEVAGASPASPALKTVDEGSLILEVLLDPNTFVILRTVALPLAQGVLLLIQLKKTMKELREVRLDELTPPVQKRFQEAADDLASSTAAHVLATANKSDDNELNNKLKNSVKYFAVAMASGAELRLIPAEGSTDIEATKEATRLLEKVVEAQQLLAAASNKSLPKAQ